MLVFKMQWKLLDQRAKPNAERYLVRERGDAMNERQ